LEQRPALRRGGGKEHRDNNDDNINKKGDNTDVVHVCPCCV
jgi:hypothetical protein